MHARIVAACFMAAVASAAHAQPIVIADSGDSAWVLASVLLALFAIVPGLALFHGRGRTGPTGFALFVTVAIVTLLFAGVGYSLIFAEGSGIIGGLSVALLRDLAPVLEDGTVSEAVFVAFELTLATFAVCILVASTAERARAAWLIPFAALWTLVVYVPAARWVWAGWLGDLGTVDYAGALPVHVAAGFAALVVALMLRDGGTRDVQHDSRLAIAGSALIWIGWLALIGGAALGGGEDAALAVLNAHVAAAAAIVAGLALERMRVGAVSVYGVANNALAGLAAASAGAAFIGVAGGLMLGVAGAIAYAVANLLVERLRLGSAAAAFSIHALPAMAGAIAFPLFMAPALGGVGFEEGTGLVSAIAAQAVAALAIALWSIVATAIAAVSVSTVVPMKARPLGD